MKIRQGFVSNSSSSSFLLVGVRIGEEEVKKMGYNQEDYCWSGDSDWADSGHGVIGNHKDGKLMIVGVDGEPCCIGIDAQQLIEKDKKLSEIKEIFKEEMKKAKIPFTGVPQLINDTFSDG